MPTAELPADLMLERDPPDALNVVDAKEIAEPGHELVVRGRIGGSVRPFVNERAVFTIVGRGPHACADHENDSCVTGWDFCCTPPEVLRSHMATIRIVDDEGVPVRTGFRGFAGIKELSDVTVVGRVSSADRDTLVIDATGIYVNAVEEPTEQHAHP